MLKTVLLSALLLTILIPFNGFYYIQKVFNQFALQSQSYKRESLEKKHNTDYEKLISKQEEEAKKRTNLEKDSDKETRPKAIGNNTLHMVFTYPPSTTLLAIKPLVAKLTEESNNYSSLNYINSFYLQEMKKYEIKDFSLDIKFHEPILMQSLNKAGDFANFWGKDPFAVAKLQDSFAKLSSDNNIKFGDNDFVLYLYFDNSLESPNEDSSSFYDHKKFRSFADDKTKRAYVNIYDFDTSFAQTATEIVAHETLHLFGATDKYEESKSETRICSKKGWGDIEKNPSIPQETADIMCMYIEKDDEEFSRAYFKDKTLVINSKTAQEIGWK